MTRDKVQTLERGQVRRALLFIVSDQPWRTGCVIGLTLLAGFAEGMSIAALLPLLGQAVDAVGDANPINRFVTAGFAAAGLQPSLVNILLLIVLSITLKSLLSMMALRQAGFAAAAAARHLRLSLIQALMRARWSHFTHLASGRIGHAVVSEPGRAASVYNAASAIAASLVQTCVYAAIAFSISWRATLLAAACGLVVVRALRILVDVARAAGRRQTKLLQSMSGRMVDCISLFKPLKAMNLVDSVAPLLERESRDLEQTQRNLASSNAALSSYYEPLVVLFIAIGVYGATTWFQMPFIDLVFLALLFHRTAARLGILQLSYQRLVANESALALLHRLISEARSAEEEVPHGTAAAFVHSIQFRGVGFDYGSETVLRDVDLEIPTGAIVALAGPSGAGKTTVLDLLSGLLRPTSGAVLVDGVDLQRLDLAEWRSRIGYVPQEALLFHDTLVVNVTLNDPRISAADTESALHAANGDFAYELPEGLNTIVGERGGRLSGGQRQRIALARALARQPRLLILDEATSALDAETERLIIETLISVKGRMTVVVTAHRPALLEAADYVYELNGGRVVRKLNHVRRAMAEPRRDYGTP